MSLILEASGSYWRLFVIPDGDYLSILAIMHFILPRFVAINLPTPPKAIF
jgi:hypothetical protein